MNIIIMLPHNVPVICKNCSDAEIHTRQLHKAQTWYVCTCTCASMYILEDKRFPYVIVLKNHLP